MNPISMKLIDNNEFWILVGRLVQTKRGIDVDHLLIYRNCVGSDKWDLILNHPKVKQADMTDLHNFICNKSHVPLWSFSVTVSQVEF